MREIVLTFGLIAGAMLSVMLILTLPFRDEIDLDKGEIIVCTSMVLAFRMVYFGAGSSARRKCMFPHHQHPTSEVL